MDAPEESAGAIALAMRGLEGAEGPRAALQRIRALGFALAQLDASAAGLRPRELSRSDRRGLAALLRRMELRVAGVDLFIPPAHLLEPARADRALAALQQAVEFSAEIASLTAGSATLCCELPAQGADEARDWIAAFAAREGARVADFAWPAAKQRAAGALGAGLDPAVALRHGEDPAALAGVLGSRLFAARLTDEADGARAAPGAGRLDVRAFRGALSAAGLMAPVVVDLRGVRDQTRAAAAAQQAWRRAAARTL